MSVSQVELARPLLQPSPQDPRAERVGDVARREINRDAPIALEGAGRTIKKMAQQVGKTLYSVVENTGYLLMAAAFSAVLATVVYFSLVNPIAHAFHKSLIPGT